MNTSINLIVCLRVRTILRDNNSDCLFPSIIYSHTTSQQPLLSIGTSHTFLLQTEL